MNQILQWLAFIFGVSGAFLVAGNHVKSKYGFLLFIASNICLIWFAINLNAYGLLLMELVYFGINIYSIRNWFVDEPNT